MTQDITIKQIDNDVRDLKQELITIKNDLQKKQAEKASRLEDSLFSPELFDHYQKVSQTLSKTGMIPKQYIGKPDDIFVAMAMGYQLGFSVEQSLQDIAVVNGRPCLWGDGLLALCLNHPECEGIDEEPVYNGQNVIGYTCSVKRKNHAIHTQTFTLQDAERAGLLKKGGVWNQYPTRMLQMRARSLALRDKFADALRGLRVADVEQEDARIIDAEVSSEKQTTQTEKLKEQLNGSGNTESENTEDVSRETSQTVYNSGSDEEPISQIQINQIERGMIDKGFDDARRKRALDYFKVDQLSQLTDAQARVFLLQLDKA